MSGASVLYRLEMIYAWKARFDSRLILSHFLNHFTFHVIKGVRNDCPCIVEFRGTKVCALATPLRSNTARTGLRQRCASDTHNAQATMRDPFSNVQYTTNQFSLAFYYLQGSPNGGWHYQRLGGYLQLTASRGWYAACGWPSDITTSPLVDILDTL